MKAKRLYLFIAMVFLFTSCDLKDYLAIEEVKVTASPEFVLPLAHGTIGMQELVNAIQSEDSLFGQHANGDVLISFREDDIFSYNVKDLVDIGSNIDVGNIDFAVGNIKSDLDISYAITIGDLVEELGGDIQELKDYNNKPKSFPAYGYYPVPATEFKLDAIDDFEEVKFKSGKLEISMTNNLPIYGIFMTANLYDNKKKKTIERLRFGYKDKYPGYDIYYTADYFDGKFGLPGSIATANGSPGAASETLSFDLAGMNISNDISVFLDTIYTDGSGGATPIINFDHGMSFSIKLKDAVVESGRFKVPQQSIKGDLTYLEGFELGKGIQLSKAKIDGGKLNIVFTKSLAIGGSIFIEFPCIKKDVDNSNLVIQLNLSPNVNSYTIPVDLSKTTIDLSTNPAQPYNSIAYVYSANINKTTNFVDFSSDAKFGIKVSINNLKVKSADGNFGQDTYNFDESEFNLDLSIFDQINGDIKFLNPTINLYVSNPVSVPINVNLDLTAYNKKGKSQKLNTPQFILPYPVYPIQTLKESVITFDNTNSSIVDFLSLPPTQKITFAGSVQLNPEKVPTKAEPNHIEMDSKIKFDLEVIIPAKFQTNELYIEQIIPFDGQTLKMVNSAKLIVGTVNNLPFGVNLEFAFIDSLSEAIYGDTVYTELLKPAVVDNDGNVTAPASNEGYITLAPTEIPKYVSANAIKVKAIIFTSKDGKPAKLTGSNQVTLQIGIQAQPNFDQIINQ